MLTGSWAWDPEAAGAARLLVAIQCLVLLSGAASAGFGFGGGDLLPLLIAIFAMFAISLIMRRSGMMRVAALAEAYGVIFLSALLVCRR